MFKKILATLLIGFITFITIFSGTNGAFAQQQQTVDELHVFTELNFKKVDEDTGEELHDWEFEVKDDSSTLLKTITEEDNSMVIYKNKESTTWDDLYYIIKENGEKQYIHPFYDSTAILHYYLDIIETSTPEGYTKEDSRFDFDNTGYIYNENYQNGNLIISNRKDSVEPVDDYTIVVTKKWEDGLTGEEANNRAIPVIKLASYAPDGTQTDNNRYLETTHVELFPNVGYTYGHGWSKINDKKWRYDYFDGKGSFEIVDDNTWVATFSLSSFITDYGGREGYDWYLYEEEMNGYTSDVMEPKYIFIGKIQKKEPKYVIIQNTKNSQEEITVSGEKTWDDANNQDGKRPESITVNLLANGLKVDSKTVTEADDWAWSFENLNKYENGDEIEYTITENSVTGYEASYDGFNITNTHTPETIKVEGKKIWDDADNQDGKRPESITIKLYADGEKVENKIVAEADDWAWTFENKPKYNNGEEITYTVTEDHVDGYTHKIEGYNITNSYTPGKTSIDVEKAWHDNDNQDGIRPDDVTVVLVADGVDTDKTLTLSENNDWSGTFNNLDEYKAGKKINYSIKEVKVDDYTTEITGDADKGYTITNIHTPETISVSGTKTWNDADNQDGKRPATITVRLYANNKEVDTATVTDAYKFENLPKYENGKEITYTVKEDTVTGYTTTYDGFNITNSYTPETINISGKKIWNDANNQDGKRPENVTINLLADGKKIDSKTITETYSFDNLPKYNAGKKIVYTVQEEPVADYTTTYNGFDVTNSYTPAKTGLTVTKIWDDDNNRDGKRPESVTIKLLADNADTGKTLVLNAENNWTGTFTDLDVKKAGKDIVYTVDEEDVTGYTKAINGNIITNSYTPETIAVIGSKTWDDADNEDNKRPSSITINLLANNTIIDTKNVTADDNWAWTFDNLPKFDNGEEINYTISEEAVESYETVIDGYNVTNKYTPKRYDIKINKTDMNGTEIEGAAITVIGNGFKQEWISKANETMDITLKPGDYTLVETNAPEGYQKITTEINFTVAEDGTVTVNTTNIEPVGAVEYKDGVIILKNEIIEPVEETPTEEPTETPTFTPDGDSQEATPQTPQESIYETPETTTVADTGDASVMPLIIAGILSAAGIVATGIVLKKRKNSL